MGRESRDNTIQAKFKTGIEDVEANKLTDKVRYPNDKRKKPQNTTWAKVSIREGENNQVTMGGQTKRFRTLGILFVQLFTPLGEGTKTINALADTIVTEFRAVRASGIVYRTPRVEKIGRRSGEYQVNVIIPFLLDDNA